MPTIKKMYGKNAIIFRLLNNTENRIDTYIKVNDVSLNLSFGKYEVKTIVYENDTLTESYEMLV